MKALQKDFLRENKRNRGRFISVFFIVLLGAAFFSGLRASERDMLLSAEQYYDATNLMDIRVIGTLGLTDDDLTDIRQMEDVENAYGGYTADVLCTGGEKKAVRLIAYSESVNLPTVLSGRLPENRQECFLDAQILEFSDYRIGDTITFESGTDSELDSTLCRSTFTIAGIGNLPYYMDLNRGTGTVGNGKLEGFVLVEPEAFTLDCYTEIYVCIAGAKPLDSFDEAYRQKVDHVKDKIEELSSHACQRRYDSLYKDADEQIKDAKKELDDAILELENARNEISDGRQQISEAEVTLKDRQNDLDQGYAGLQEKEDELAGARQEYTAQYKAFAEKKAAFTEQQQQAEDAENQLEALREQYEEGKAAYEAILPKLNDAETFLPQISQQLTEMEQAQLTGTPEYEALLRQQGEIQALLEQGRVLKESLEEFEQKERELASAKAAIQSYAQQISEGEAKLAAAEKQIEEGASQLSAARDELDKGNKKLKKAQKKLDKKKEELEQAENDYAEAEQEALPRMADARQEIDDAEDELSKLSVPEWYILDREMISSYAGYQNDAERVANLGKLLPVIFYFVAALVALTAMTRLVEEQRQQVGTLKALGSENRSILARYLLYSLIPTASGAVAGVLIGEKVLPLAIMHTYSMLYSGLHSYLLPYNWTQGLIAVFASTICTIAATLLACYKMVRAKPAQIMRPEAPQNGKRVWLEKISFLWKRLSFTQKSTIRNLFRYKKRFFMTLFGVAGCMGLVLVGLGLHDSIMVVGDKQFSEITHYQAAVSVDYEDSSSIDGLAQGVLARDAAIAPLTAYEKSVELQSASAVQDAVLNVPQTADNITRFFTYRVRGSNEEIDFPGDGALISEKTAASLGVKIGDTIRIKNGDLEIVPVQIEGIYENYIRHYLFLSADTYQKLYGTAPEYNEILLCYPDNSEEYENDLGNYLLQQDAVQGVSFVSETIRWADDTLSSLDTIVYIVLASAGLLAFVVLYNLNSINIAERQRELGTLKVLGFYDTEVAAYVYKENFILCALGICLGMAAGVVLHQYVIKSIEVDLIMFGRTISTVSFVIGALFTFLFSVLINLAMFRSIRKIDMIESLKSIE